MFCTEVKLEQKFSYMRVQLSTGQVHVKGRKKATKNDRMKDRQKNCYKSMILPEKNHTFFPYCPPQYVACTLPNIGVT